MRGEMRKIWYNTRHMSRCCLVCAGLLICSSLQASWYWPFGSDEEEKREPRLSELMQPATDKIDEAVDLAGEGKVSEAISKYREVLAELDRVERENPERAKKSEFATLRNKRAYVAAAIDTLALHEVKQNAKAVAVSDTTALEKEMLGKKEKKDEKKPSKTTQKKRSRRAQILLDIENGNYDAAESSIKEVLASKPNNAAALNLKAALEVAQRKLKTAEKTLDKAISTNPRNYYAYYNMADLLMRQDAANKTTARRYYETGRSVGGPVDNKLEELLK